MGDAFLRLPNAEADLRCNLADPSGAISSAPFVPLIEEEDPIWI